MEELIKWMEEELNKDLTPFNTHYLKKFLAKAKELQEKEKWAVVRKDEIWKSEDEAKMIMEEEFLNPNSFTIVKIIEP